MATNFVGKIVAKLPTHPALIAPSFPNGMGYRYINVHINSTDDASASILCENFLKFGLVTSELTELICERQVRHS